MYSSGDGGNFQDTFAMLLVGDGSKTFVRFLLT